MVTRLWTHGHTDRTGLNLTSLTAVIIAIIVVLSMIGMGALAVSPSEDEMGTIEGVVTDAEGDPVEGVDVFADGEVDFFATTDADGTYEMFVDQGTYDVLAFHEESDAASEEVTVEVGPGEIVEVNLELIGPDDGPPDDEIETGTIQGTVTDADGDTVADTIVTAEAGEQGAFDETDDDGTFSFEVDPGTYEVEAFHEETGAFSEPETVDVDVDETVTVDLQLQEHEGGVDESEYVTDTSIEHVGGTAPSSMPEIQAVDVADGQINIDLTDPGQTEWVQELGELGVDSTTEFEIVVEFEDFHPRGVVATGHDLDVTLDGATMIVRAKPLDPQWIDGQPSFEDWPEGNDDQADFSFDAMLTFNVLNMDFPEDDFEADDHPMEGVVIGTDAQIFSMPQYITGEGDEPDALEITIGGPHLTVDGDENDGTYQAFLPNGLLDEWDVDSADEINAAYKGEQTDFDATEFDDGILIEMDVSYSVGTVGISPEEPASTGYTPTPDGPGDDPTPTPGDGDSIPGPGILGVVIGLLGIGLLFHRLAGRDS